MKCSGLYTFHKILLMAAMLFSSVLHAEAIINQTSNVFNFQQKLAISGNVNAQYKLGSMYETGEGVEASTEQARHWYSRAADAGSRSARQRNTYLTIKSQGYDKIKYSGWLNEVKNDAGQHKPDAVLLLGQLYRQGLGVKQDLDKSLELLNQVRILGTANVEKEIASIKREIDANSKAKSIRQQELARENARLQQAETAKQNKQQADEKKQAEAALRIKMEKRKKYEEVMRKLRAEQQLIDQQQSEVTGNDVTSIDDEI